MNNKNDVKNIGLNIDKNSDNIQIEYNDDDFTSEKTKSLNKFPLKIITNNEFYLDDVYKNFSKSLNFNFNKCYAPKPKFKQSSKNPTPIIYEKQIDICNLKTRDNIITEDAYSEKELSLGNESSYSSDLENNNNENYIFNNNQNIVNNDLIYNNKIIDDKNNINNYIISKNLLEDKKSEDKNINLYENKINLMEEDEKEDGKLKIYEHKTITAFPVKNNYNEIYAKGNIKAIRNSLFRAKMKCLKEKSKEVEYSIKNRTKRKYGLDLINKSKKHPNNIDFCKVIPININKKEEENNNNNDKEENGDDDMSNFRKTISYNTSKLSLENKKKNEWKGITIYDVLLTNKKNKTEK